LIPNPSYNMSKVHSYRLLFRRFACWVWPCFTFFSLIGFLDYDVDVVGTNGTGYLWPFDIEEEGIVPSLTGVH